MLGMKMFKRCRQDSCEPRARVAGVLRGIAGAAMGHKRTRRGSAIVLSVSALVLLSVITLVYWGLGRSDAHTAITLRRATGVDTTVNEMAAHLADVIGRDKVAWYVESSLAGSSHPSVYREAWDFPWVDANRESIPDVVKPSFFDQKRFDPAGTMPQSWDPVRTGLDILPFEGSDPWLSPHKPIYLGMTVEMTGPDWMRDARDWWSISNFAPDGRFVNLYNLRNNFASESGFSNKNSAYEGRRGSTPGAMSDYLSLIEPNGIAGITKHNGETADPNVPADWSMYQANMFRPTVDVLYGVDDPRHGFYQRADTDGDGFFDARWFEMVDASVSDRLISLLPRDDTMRWFFAARAVDLSGLVNVNTAVDLRGDGNDQFRLGASSADIDFLRILMMQDSSIQNFDPLDPATEGAYSNIVQGDPRTGSTPIPADYSLYTMDLAANIAIEADAARTAYFRSRVVPAPGPVPPVTLSAKSRFDRYTEDATGVLPGEPMVNVTGLSTAETSSIPLFGLASLTELLTYRGTNDDANTSTLERVLGGRFDPGYFSPLRDNRPLFLEQLHAELALAQNPTTGNAATESMIWSAMDVRQLLTTYSGAIPMRSSRLRYDVGGPNEVRSLIESTSTIGGYWEVDNLVRPRSNFEGRHDAASLMAAGAQGQPLPLFRAYAEALLPHAGELENDWEQLTNSEITTDTLFYGHNPVRALVTAAQMAANAIDMYDNVPRGVQDVTVVTVATSQEEANKLDSDPRYYSWHRERRLPDGGVDYPYRMILDDDDVHFETLANEVPAVNVFGIEPQPFLVEVNSYFMYSDVWFDPFTATSPAGDEDGGVLGDLTASPPIKNKPEPFTIHGDVTYDNIDFMMEAIAFQITNPFDRPINLWSSVSGGSKYYIEYGDHIFPLGRISQSDHYRISDDYDALVRPNPKNIALSNVKLLPGETKEFFALCFDEADINDRLRETSEDGSFIPTMRDWIKTQFGDEGVQIAVAVGGVALTSDEPIELVERGMGLDESVVRLWRALDLITDSPRGGNPQIREDDLLVDRMRDPGDPGGSSYSTLDRTLPPEQNKVTGSIAYKETGLRSTWEDNAGYSIVRSGSIRRVGDGSVVTATHREFPSWCIERKYAGMAGSLNESDAIGGPRDTIGMSHFDSTSNSSSVTAGTFPMEELFDDQALPTGSMLFGTFGQEPYEKGDSAFANSAGVSYANVQAEIHFDNRQFAGNNDAGHKLRVGDMLLPMGVGPMHIPDELQGSVEDDQRWTTLGETMALATGFDSDPGNTSLFGNMDQQFDKGHLRLDTEGQFTPNAYLPFVDLDGNGIYESDEDEKRGAGIPIAYNVLDVFSTTDVRFGSMRRPRLGVINANTAPLDVLRTVPLLSPPPSIDGGQKRWWWAGGSGAPNDQSDVAASLFAYTHKAIVPSISTVVDIADFTNGGLVGDPTNFARAQTNSFDGMRETPGLRSIGEVLAVRSGTSSTDRMQDIDYMAHDANDIDMKGVESIRYKSGSASDGMIDDYDEKLAVINSLLGTTDVRSDYFAVWFVVHGYQQDDVEGLRPEDPLTPTVAKRFVMVVDRTNVQRLGDKPRILMIQEVPM